MSGACGISMKSPRFAKRAITNLWRSKAELLFSISVRTRSYSGTGLFGLSHFGHGTFRSDYEILQKSYSIAMLSRLIQSALPPSSYCRLPKVEAFHSKCTPFTIRYSGKRCRQGILLGIKFLVVQNLCKVTESVVSRA